jgi:uncharacterized protein YhaN
MADDLMIERVEKLEKALESLAEELPQQMSVQLREDLRDEFSAVLKEAAATRSDLLELFDAGSRATEALFKETWAQMRTLHEDVISRITRLGEASPPRERSNPS